jgi:hypothetical protein
MTSNAPWPIASSTRSNTSSPRSCVPTRRMSQCTHLTLQRRLNSNNNRTGTLFQIERRRNRSSAIARRFACCAGRSSRSARIVRSSSASPDSRRRGGRGRNHGTSLVPRFRRSPRQARAVDQRVHGLEHGKTPTARRIPPGIRASDHRRREGTVHQASLICPRAGANRALDRASKASGGSREAAERGGAPRIRSARLEARPVRFPAAPRTTCASAPTRTGPRGGRRSSPGSRPCASASRDH